MLQTIIIAEMLSTGGVGQEVIYQIASFPMTLDDLQGNSPIANLLKVDFLYCCAAAYKISADLERRAVPLR